MHLAAATGAGATVALQLHTNLEPTLNGDALVSNGTRAPFAGTHADRLWQALRAASGVDARLKTVEAWSAIVIPAVEAAF